MEHIRGVNLGGWFVLEMWMRPALFEGVSGPDETVFSLEKKNAEDLLRDHRDAFITEEDIRYLKNVGINCVRLPLPWWFLGEHPYIRSVEKIDQVVGWFEKYEMPFLLDLHTAPGCQNGFDNGGITGKIDWPKDPNHIAITIEKLIFLTKRYGKSPMFFGIEALNEPHMTIDLKLIQDFYLTTYRAIRPLTNGMIVFHDAFRPQDPSWKPFFETNGFINVALDAHIYYCFSPHFGELSFVQLLQNVLDTNHQMLTDISTFVKVIVGEWSLGLNEKRFEGLDCFRKDTMLRAFANAQLASLETLYGWFFWSYHIDRESHRSWDLRRLIDADILPHSYSDAEVKQ
jgi:glucan 1,3-beta-glucosidase